MSPSDHWDPSTAEDATSPTSSAPSPGELELLRRRVGAAVARTCPPWLSRQADDIVQTVLIQLVAGREQAEGSRHYSSMYLQKAADGALVDEIRRLARRRELQDGEGAASLAEQPSPAADPERAALGHEISAKIRECLQGLVRGRRMAVILHLQGCSVSEVARRSGWSNKRAENLVYRGLADLRRCLRRKGMTP